MTNTTMNPLEQRIISIKWDMEFNERMMEELKKRMQDAIEEHDHYIATFMVGLAQEFKGLYEKNRELDLELKSLMRIKKYYGKED